jgi:hypothetical protein
MRNASKGKRVSPKGWPQKDAVNSKTVDKFSIDKVQASISMSFYKPLLAIEIRF